MGKRNNHAHTHLPAPELLHAEQKREALKKEIRDEPKAKRGHVIANIRDKAADETFVAMGTDNALAIMAHRSVGIWVLGKSKMRKI